MTYPEFQRFIGDLVDYYSRGVLPKNNAVRMWYETVKHIPARDLKPIFRQLTQANWPANVPAEINRAWSGSAKSGDNDQQPAGCPECENGILFMKRKTDFGYYGKFLFRCGRCRTSNLAGIPEATAKELVADGWLYDVPNEFEPDERDGLWRGEDAEDHA